MFATNLVEAVKSIPFAVSCSQDGFIRERKKKPNRIIDYCREVLFTEAKETNWNATVQDEIRTVESYMAIQKFRYQNRVEFETYMSEDTGGYMVPRMILQPLVENSIYYGVDKSLSTCVIRVRAEVKDTWIVLSVEDNGSGMEAEELEEVRKGTITPKGHGIGLKNIRERMKMAYEDSGFVIESRPGEGTRIEIWLPKQQLDR